MMLRTLLSAVVLIAALCTASATDYYANSVTGSDANPGTSTAPVQTLAKGVSLLQSNNGDRLLLTGQWQETLVVHLNGVTVLGLGSAVIANTTQTHNIGLAIDTNGSAIDVENITVRNVPTGLAPNGANHTYRRLCFRGCLVGFDGGLNYSVGIVSSLVSQCDFLGCNDHAFIDYDGSYNVYERCTFINNQFALAVVSEHNTIRDCIVANNGYGIRVIGFASTSDYDLVFNNGDSNGSSNYYWSGVGGPHDLQQVDPQFISSDPQNLNVALKRTSPAINAGVDSDGLPVTIGAHEIGTLSSGTAAATVSFSTWTDANGASVTSGGSQITLSADGYLRLASGVTTAAALSPAMDMGDANAIVTNATFQAIQDFTQPSGSRQQVSLFEIRISPNPFNASDASPAWQTITSNQSLSVAGRYVQLRITLTTQGQ